MPSHDHAERRASVRRGKERGCWLYVTASALARAGFAAGDPPPFYRTWASARGRVAVQLYRSR